MKKIKYIVGLFTVFVCHELLPMSSTKPKLGLSIKNLKGTHEVLKDYPGYEPFWGLVFAEKDVAKNLYTFSTHQIKKEASEIIKKADADLDFFKKPVEDFLQDKQNTATQNLVRQMFHEVGGTFNVTNAQNNPIKQFTPEHVGKVLRIVHDSGVNYAKMEVDLKKYLLSLGLLDPKGKPFPGKDFNPFIKSLVGSLQECSALNSDVLFAPGTAQGIVLGYLLLKANDRADLERYFTGFLGTDITLPQEQYSNQDFQNILSAASNLQDEKQFAEFVCAMIYQQKYASFFPKLSTSKMVNYAGVSFTDCVESMMLNVINIATYNQEDKVLGFAPKELTMNNALLEFYKQHEDASNIDHASVNQAWTDSVVQNVEGIAYNRIVDPVSKGQLQVREFCDGAIPVEEIDASLPVKRVQVGQKDFRVYEKSVGDQRYWLVPRQTGLVCCELMPTASNVVVLMNNLFHLLLYSKIEDIFNPNFAKTHFTQMCQKFNWNLKKEDHREIVIQVIGGKSFTIHLIPKSHGYITINQISSAETLGVDSSNFSLGKQAVCVALGLNNIQTDFLSALFYKQLLNPDDRLEAIKTGVLLHDKRLMQFLDNLIISFSLQEDNYYRNDLIQIYKKHPYKSIEIMFDLVALESHKGIRQFFEFCQKCFCDLAHKNQLLLFIDLTIKREESIDQAFSLATEAIIKHVLSRLDIQQILLWIQVGIENKHMNVQRKSLLLAQEAVGHDLFDKSYAEQIILWILKSFKSKNKFLQSASLALAKKAIEKKLFDKSYVEQLVSLLQISLDSKEKYLEPESIAVLYELVAKDLIGKSRIEQIMQWIFRGIKSSDRSVLSESLRLAKEVVIKGLLDRAGIEPIVLLINASLGSRILIVFDSLDLALTALKKDLFDRSHVEQIASWILEGIKINQSLSLVLALEALRKNLLDRLSVEEVVSWAHRVAGSKDASFKELIIVFEQEATNKGLLSKQLRNDDSLVFDEQESGMMALATRIGARSKAQMDRVRAGLPADLPAIWQKVKEQFVPPSADRLEQQQEAIETFNRRNVQQQELQPPFDLQLPQQQAAGQMPAQPAGMFAGWQAKGKDALRRSMRSIRR